MKEANSPMWEPGGGFFTVRLARALGKNGCVYAEDIREEVIQTLE